MSETWFTLIDDGRPVEVPATIVDGALRVSHDALRTALGWQVTPEGLCRDGVCVPVEHGPSPAHPQGVDLAELAGALERPLALDLAEHAAYLGVSARERAEILRSLRAPDFALPDLDGRRQTLSEHRGKKVLLVAYASW